MYIASISLKIQNMMNINVALFQYFISSFSIGIIKIEIMSNQELPLNYTNQLLKKIEKSKEYSSLKDNIWGADLADLHLISKYNKGFQFYYVLLIFKVNIHELFF